ncbi:Rha family transcriptional regulator [Xanthobacter sp. V4C-4]|uniref:Rha family transcriptional regulator n=1 Tax=Xanthobacter cornucopiae TaxID=3119924 RepID=UPI00372A90D8
MFDTATHTAPTTTTFAAVPAILPTTGAAPGEPLTMSSREIAELLGNRHDNVKRTVETLAGKGVFKFPQSEEIPTATKPMRVREYRLDKRSSLIVVAQLSPEFTARVVDRWQELEAQLAGAFPQLPNFLDPAEAAEAFAKEYRGRMIEAQRAAVAEEKLATAGPKADAP